MVIKTLILHKLGKIKCKTSKYQFLMQGSYNCLNFEIVNQSPRKTICKY